MTAEHMFIHFLFMCAIVNLATLAVNIKLYTEIVKLRDKEKK